MVVGVVAIVGVVDIVVDVGPHFEQHCGYCPCLKTLRYFFGPRQLLLLFQSLILLVVEPVVTELLLMMMFMLLLLLLWS